MRTLVNVDLVEALRSIIKLKVDHYQDDIVYDILDLANAKANDYFCFMARDSGTWLFEQKQVYIKDTQANITWKHYENSEVSTYAVEITQKKDNKIIGNIYEIDYKKTLEDVKLNEKEIEKIEVTFNSDNKIIFDADEFKKEKGPIINKFGEIKDTKPLIKDYFYFNLHQNKLRSERIKKQKLLKLDDYLQDINKEKLNGLGYKKNDIYYISSSDCKKLLEKTSINVYMLKGNEKVKIDEPINNYEKPVYGIWIEDKKRFDAFDRNELNKLIKDHVNERNKKQKLLEFGYDANDIYLLDNNKKIKNVFNQKIPLYAIDKDFNKIPLNDMKEVINHLGKKSIIVADIYYKEEIKEIENGNNQSNYIDVLDKKEIKIIINMQIKEATYFNRLKEDEGHYLSKNIDRISENLINEYELGINISDKIEDILRETLKDKGKGIEERNEIKSLKDRINKAKDKANKDISRATNKDIERNQ